MDVGAALGLTYQRRLLSAPGSCGAEAVVTVRLARLDSHPSVVPACADVCLLYFCENWVAGGLWLYVPRSPERVAVGQTWDCALETRPRAQGAGWPLGGLVLTGGGGGAQRDSGKLSGGDIQRDSGSLMWLPRLGKKKSL